MDRPELEIARAGDAVIVSWRSDEGQGYTLRGSDNLSSDPVEWSKVAAEVVVAGERSQVTIPTRQAQAYYRLAMGE